MLLGIHNAKKNLTQSPIFIYLSVILLLNFGMHGKRLIAQGICYRLKNGELRNFLHSHWKRGWNTIQNFSVQLRKKGWKVSLTATITGSFSSIILFTKLQVCKYIWNFLAGSKLSFIVNTTRRLKNKVNTLNR